MSSDQELPLDEHILQIFEEQEDQFYYPITTQNTARNFVKALNAKGVSYEDVYHEIDEFEHNFSAWRKGLGRIGIGKRMIERINKPLHDVLLSDDEDDINEILNRIKEKDNAATRPENNRVPPITTVVHTEETRIVKLKDNIHRRNGENGDASDKEPSFAKSKLKDRSSPESDSSSSNTSSPVHTPKLIHGPRPVAGAEFAQKEPGVVDFRSVLKRASRNQDPNAGDRRSMPPNLNSLEDLRAGLNKTKLGGSADKIHSLHSKSASNGTKDTSLRSKDTEPKITASQDKSGVLKNTPKSLQEEESPKHKKPDSENETDFIDDLVNSFDNEPLPDSAKPSPQKTAPKTQTAPLAAEDSDDDLSSTSSIADSDSNHTSDSGVTEDNRESPEKGGQTEEEETVINRDPNYDSDLDEDNDDLIREGKSLAQQIAKYKAKASLRDGPGYLYVFKDTLSSHAQIGNSRMPKKRLEQALCYNINLELVSALPVSLRRMAVQRARTRLDRFRVKGQETWFDGPMDEIIRVVTSTAERYPKNSTEC